MALTARTASHLIYIPLLLTNIDTAASPGLLALFLISAYFSLSVVHI